MITLSNVDVGRPRSGAVRSRTAIAAFIVATLLAAFLRPIPARAEDPPVPADRSMVLSAWRLGGIQVRAGAAVALVGSDDDVRQFLTTGLPAAQQADERDTLTDVIAQSGPSVRAAGQQALNSGDAATITAFLSSGWQGPADIDTRVSVDQLMAVGGPQVRQAAQAVLDTEDADAMRTFLDSGWQAQWQTDQRLRVNQALAAGGPQVRAAAQKALDAGTPEALEGFLEYGWAVASALDDEVATLTEILAQAQAAGELAEQETQRAQQEGAKAKDAADAAKRAAADAAAATEAARQHSAEAAAHAQRAAAAADKAAQAARVAVDAAAAASRAARAASIAAGRAAHAAAKAEDAAAKAHKAAADAATDGSKAALARLAAQYASSMADQARSLAAAAERAGQVDQALRLALQAAGDAAESARQAAAYNLQAATAAQQAGADASAAVAAAQRARDNADRALRAVAAAQNFLTVAIRETLAARDSALRSAVDASAAATAAIEAADHAGEAGQAATRATDNANAATHAAQGAIDAATQANAVYEAARQADAERLAVFRDERLEAAQAANVQYEAQQRQADWDVEEAAKRSAETDQLIALVQNPATDPASAVPAARKVALALADGQSAATRQAALAALAGDDAQVLDFVRTGLAKANAQDDRYAVMNLAVTPNTALKDAALAALNGSDATVKSFLRTQNYPGRYTQDRLKVNQILAAAKAANDTVLAQAAQAALNAETLQALRDFLDEGQYTAAATGERVRVNQVAAAGGPEVKAAAQIALDGPPTGLREFLTTGQYFAAERDYEGAAHLAVVGGLLQRINEVAETAIQNSLLAQSVAAQARNDAAQAADYANQAQNSAVKASGYAAAAQAYVTDAAQSVDKAAAAVATAKSAAVRAVGSARDAIKSASWAIVQQKRAIDAAQQANAAAKRAYASALAAGQQVELALAAGRQAAEAIQTAKGLEIAKCDAQYANSASSELEKQLTGSEDGFYRACVELVIGKPEDLATRAYMNAAMCDNMYPDQGQLYQNCIHSTLDPEFRGVQPLMFASQVVSAAALQYAVPVGIVAGVLCMALLACGASASALMTMWDVGLNGYKFINGYQTLARTLLNIGETVLVSALTAAVGKFVGAGFGLLKMVYTATRDIRRVNAELKALDVVRLAMVGPAACLKRTGAPCRLILGLRTPGEALAAELRGYTFNNPALADEVGTKDGLAYALWMYAVDGSLLANTKISVAMDGFRFMNAATIEDAKLAYVEAYRLGKAGTVHPNEWMPTPWEMYRIGEFTRNGPMEWKNIDWYLGKTKINLPEPTWYKDAAGQWLPRFD